MNANASRFELRREPRKIQARSFWIAAASVAVVVSTTLYACSARPPEAPSAPQTLYTAEEAVLFNDLFRAELFGFDASEGDPESDGLLPERAAKAERVVAVRVVTVTRVGNEASASYSLVVQPIAAPLVGAPDPAPFTLTVGAKNPVYAWIEADRAAWIGIRALVFVRSYEDGLHFHATVDTPRVREAVTRARIERTGRR